jgi:hypothetical protein
MARKKAAAKAAEPVSFIDADTGRRLQNVLPELLATFDGTTAPVLNPQELAGTLRELKRRLAEMPDEKLRPLCLSLPVGMDKTDMDIFTKGWPHVLAQFLPRIHAAYGDASLGKRCIDYHTTIGDNRIEEQVFLMDPWTSHLHQVVVAVWQLEKLPSDAAWFEVWQLTPQQDCNPQAKKLLLSATDSWIEWLQTQIQPTTVAAAAPEKPKKTTKETLRAAKPETLQRFIEDAAEMKRYQQWKRTHKTGTLHSYAASAGKSPAVMGKQRTRYYTYTHQGWTPKNVQAELDRQLAKDDS